MDILVIMLPLSTLLASIFLVLFVRSVRSGQYDDLDDPSVRILHDDDEAPPTPDA